MQMAIDEALAIACSENKSPPTLRFYTFAPPAITIGRHQKLADFNLDKINEKGFSLVRRITGGTAVLHKNDLVYSLVMPENFLPEKVADAYRFLSGGLVEGLKNLRLNAKKKIVKNTHRQSSCYLNQNPYDVVVNNKKISGNAQARINGVVLQHGTIIIEDNLQELIDCLNLDGCQKLKLCQQSEKKVTNLKKELTTKINVSEVEKAMALGFYHLFRNKNIKFEEKNLTANEKKLAKELCSQKYSTSQWQKLGQH